jgi:hypothetical protein
MVMAIFVLLFLMMMAQVKPPAPAIPDLRDRVAELERAVGAVGAAAGRRRAQGPDRARDRHRHQRLDGGAAQAISAPPSSGWPRKSPSSPICASASWPMAAATAKRLNRPWREFPLQSVALADPPANTRDFHRLDPRLRQFLDVEIKDLSGGNVDVVAAVGKALNFFAQHGRPGGEKGVRPDRRRRPLRDRWAGASTSADSRGAVSRRAWTAVTSRGSTRKSGNS